MSADGVNVFDGDVEMRFVKSGFIKREIFLP